ncbi:MAG: 6-carboxytetrahydropterin synthase [Bdellovibrionales bacterium]|nr:6-carboxytetrahydropterin synthase [Bdellovibrionales bacterium]
MKTSLLVKVDLMASHSLAGNEVPHPHRFRIVVEVTGHPVEGRIIDLPSFESAVVDRVRPLQNQYLNESETVDSSVRAFPTCETIAAFLFPRVDQDVLSRFRNLNPSLRLTSVSVTLFDLDSPDGRPGKEYGTARVSD